MSSTSEEEMATLAADTTPSTQPFKQRRKSCARKVERFCWLGLTYFPLTFVYGLTTWAVWVETTVSFIDGTTTSSYLTAGLGILFYSLANISYTIAVFTPPGSPLDHPSQSTRRGRGGRYESLPTYENEEEAEVPSDMSTVTAKASGKKRYCKKCRVVKPDRTHHCSTCGKCVMKMDHHCPWLATCVGLRNYKAFLLFLVYTCFFCWTCFAVSFRWTWDNIVQEAIVDDGWRLVNTILLAVLGGIIGLVLSGFTSWHIYLTLHGATTIESLEKTRYLNPLRKSVQQQFEHHRNYLSQDGTAQPSFTDRMTEIHANALPGVLRPEEGNIEIPVNTPPQALRPTDSPARDSLQQSYASLEAQREHDRYEAYLDEKDSDKLPNAFDLGWKRNVLHVLGPAPLLWLLPICNTTGDGWRWEVSRKWQAARDDIAKERTRRQQETARWDVHNTNTQQQSGQDVRWMPGQGFVPRVQPPPRNSERDGMSLHTFDAERNGLTGPHNHNAEQSRGTSNWNDIPDDFLDRPDSRSRSSRSQVRAKGD